MNDSSAKKDDAEILRDLADRAEITALLHRYVEGVHHNDASIIASVFSDDAELAFPRGPVTGIENIRTYFQGGLGPDKAKRMGLDALLDVTPMISNIHIALESDRAKSVCTCVAFNAAVRDGETVLLIGALRNDDELVRTAEGWRISRREKTDLWRTELPATSSLKPE